jgi:hypothetical protein
MIVKQAAPDMGLGIKEYCVTDPQKAAFLIENTLMNSFFF